MTVLFNSVRGWVVGYWHWLKVVVTSIGVNYIIILLHCSSWHHKMSSLTINSRWCIDIFPIKNLFLLGSLLLVCMHPLQLCRVFPPQFFKL
ncbi:unnamed protein product [Moneuplotes crassus]|uniref:Uncharacterized protein n=1 Tax=Euplotes crassus TaxID=5936 RepID=A0AAD1XCQ0_EUPCR|nr:unnamed protein product [Moneuplotes crassus]